MEKRECVVRCRAVIVHEGKLFVVKHSHGAEHWALPGGHLEGDEGVVECMRREVVEELGVEPEIGRLLYVHTFTDRFGKYSVEFFFEVKNGEAFTDLEGNERTHAHEIGEILWSGPEDDVRILPEVIVRDLKNGTILSDEVRFVNVTAPGE